MSIQATLEKRRKTVLLTVILLFLAVASAGIICLFTGSSDMTLSEGLSALFGQGADTHSRIIFNIRLPRVLAAIIAGAGLSAAGLIMQTVLDNPLAAPSTLGVADGAVFGANLSLLVLSSGFFASLFTGFVAFVFATLSAVAILLFCRARAFSPVTVVLAGLAVGAVFKAGTTILQFYADDVSLSSAVVWSFGDLGRATYETDLIMLAVLVVGLCFFVPFMWKYNLLLGGEGSARALGVNVNSLCFISLLLASVITAVCVSFLGVIGFVGIICPHVAKRIFGQDHRITLPVSLLLGSLLLLLSDTLSRILGGGAALPVGAITSLFGAPFFIAVIFGKREGKLC